MRIFGAILYLWISALGDKQHDSETLATNLFFPSKKTEIGYYNLGMPLGATILLNGFNSESINLVQTTCKACVKGREDVLKRSTIWQDRNLWYPSNSNKCLVGTKSCGNSEQRQK